MQNIATRRRDCVDAAAIWIAIGLCATWNLQQFLAKIIIKQGLRPTPPAALRPTIATLYVFARVAWRYGRAWLADL